MRWWHFLPIVMILIINTVGLTMVFRRVDKFLKAYPPSTIEALRFTTAEISDKLTQLQSRLALLQSPENSSVLGTASSSTEKLSDLLPNVPNTSSTTSLHYISISEDFTDPVKIYKEAADFSPIIGQLVPGQKYPFTDHDQSNNWYQVSLSGGVNGWVQSAHIHEVL